MDYLYSPCCNPDCKELHGGMSQYCSRSCMWDDMNNYWPDEPSPYIDALVDTLLEDTPAEPAQPKHKKAKTVTFKDDIAEEITVSRWLPDLRQARDLAKTYTRKQLEHIGIQYNVGRLYKYPTKLDLAKAIVLLM